jgi:hypothetical protein
MIPEATSLVVYEDLNYECMRPSATTSPTSLVYEALSYLAGARTGPLLERLRFSTVGQSFYLYFFPLCFTFLLATWQVLAQLLG